MVNEMESVVKSECHQTLKARNVPTLNSRKENFTKIECGKLEIYDLSLQTNLNCVLSIKGIILVVNVKLVKPNVM